MRSKNKRKDVPEAVTDTRKDTYDWIQCLISALIICVLLFVFVIRVVDVRGTSMWPTLQNGDKMLVSDLFYKPKQGDIVVFKKDEYDPDKALVKRVIAVEGQEVNIDFANGLVYVDGQKADKPGVSYDETVEIEVRGAAEGCVFVMGDNRNASTDSRDKRIGMVDERLIIGKVYMVIYPLSEFGVAK